MARLTASCDGGVTRLTCVAHRAPARLLPLRGALADAAGAATCVLGSFGGGLLGGDRVDLHVRAERDATLLLGTQASTKIYRTKSDGHPALQVMQVAVDDGALLVWAPDPLVPFARSAYEGTQRFDLQRGASLVAIDWLGAGRAICGERWAFSSYASRTEARLVAADNGVTGEPQPPPLIEALSLPPGCPARRAASFDVGGVTRDAVVSVVVGGPRASAVAARLHAAAALLAQRRTGGRGVRDARNGVPSVLHEDAQSAAASADENEKLLGSLLGDVVLGVSDVPLPAGSAAPVRPGASAIGEHAATPKLTVARLVAEHNEDGALSTTHRAPRRILHVHAHVCDHV